MTVAELIEVLRGMPQDLEVRAWGADEDDYVTVAGAIFEDGATTVDLITEVEQ